MKSDPHPLASQVMDVKSCWLCPVTGERAQLVIRNSLVPSTPLSIPHNQMPSRMVTYLMHKLLSLIVLPQLAECS
jgi:hypothetical protein